MNASVVSHYVLKILLAWQGIKSMDWSQVGMSAAMGAVGGVGASIGRAYTKNAFKHSVSNMTWKESSKKWKTVSQRYRKYINDSGVAPAKKWEAHHWFIERNGKFNNFLTKKYLSTL